eukprot:g4484.t1
MVPGNSTLPFVNSLPDNLKLWGWYICMVVFCGALNLGLLAARWKDVQVADSYDRAMKWLAVPWVWECAWRSVFPSLYLQRFAFWDTPLNSIIVDRTWACFGELSWTYQIALALRHVDRDITAALSSSSSSSSSSSRSRSSSSSGGGGGGGGGTWWVQASAWLAFFAYVVAECISYYNTATTNEWWAAAEVFVDGLSFLVMAPACIVLLCRCPGKICASSAKIFLLVMSITTVAYPAYNFFVDVPMYMTRYRADQAANKTYLPFLKGLEDAAVTRHVTHRLQDWSGDMSWMIMYFTFGAWSGLALMRGPRLPPSSYSYSSAKGSSSSSSGDLLLSYDAHQSGSGSNLRNYV